LGVNLTEEEVESVPDAKAGTLFAMSSMKPIIRTEDNSGMMRPLSQTKPPVLAPTPIPQRAGFVPIYSLPLTTKITSSPPELLQHTAPPRPKRRRSGLRKKDDDELVEDDEEADEGYSGESDYEIPVVRGRRGISSPGHSRFNMIEGDNGRNGDKELRHVTRPMGRPPKDETYILQPGESAPASDTYPLLMTADGREDVHPMAAPIPSSNGEAMIITDTSETQIAQMEAAQVGALRALLVHQGGDPGDADRIVDGLPLNMSAEFEVVVKAVGIPLINRLGLPIDPTVAQQLYQ